MKKYKIGYTQGVFDMFHIGHLNILDRAKQQCDYSIVGVNSDKLVNAYKHKLPVVNERDRQKIVSSIKAVDKCIIVDLLDKVEIWNQLNFNAVFIGDDWKGNPRWIKTENDLNLLGVDVIYLPYTSGISSSLLRKESEKQMNGNTYNLNKNILRRLDDEE